MPAAADAVRAWLAAAALAALCGCGTPPRAARPAYVAPEEPSFQVRMESCEAGGAGRWTVLEGTWQCVHDFWIGGGPTPTPPWADKRLLPRPPR